MEAAVIKGDLMALLWSWDIVRGDRLDPWQTEAAEGCPRCDDSVSVYVDSAAEGI